MKMNDSVWVGDDDRDGRRRPVDRTPPRPTGCGSALLPTVAAIAVVVATIATVLACQPGTLVVGHPAWQPTVTEHVRIVAPDTAGWPDTWVWATLDDVCDALATWSADAGPAGGQVVAALVDQWGWPAGEAAALVAVADEHHCEHGVVAR